MASQNFAAILKGANIDYSKYEDLYKHFHQNPELSDLEEETAKRIVQELEKLGAFKITTNIGGYGLVGIMENGKGNTVLLRSDMDALPILEKTGLPYASTKKMADVEGVTQPTMHACGHDVHMTCLIAAADALIQLKDQWSGTLIVLFQPAEERGTGAKAMVDDGLYTKHKVPVPDYLLGQHVVAMKTGTLGSRSGTLMAGADSLKITIHGQGGHGSQPHTTIDPVVMASHIVVRLQSIVSREINPSDISVLTVGCLKAGQIENVIADHAEIGVDTRSMRPETREKLLASIRRVVDAECQASNATAPPEYKISRHFPVTSNDASMTETLVGSFKSHFGESYQEMQAVTMSEDFSILATSQNRPSVFWAFGGIEAGFWDQKVAEGKVNEVPSNHTSKFAPVLDPTLRTGVEAFTVGALTFFNKK